MRVCFCTKPKNIAFEMDLDVVPRVGEYVCHYARGAGWDDEPTVYQVRFVVHAYDHRADLSEPHAYVRVKKAKDPFRKKRPGATRER
jgi:hypothetical protein